MSKKKPVYRATRGVAVRLSTDPESPDYETFVDWQAGDLIADAPAHTNWDYLLAVGAIEEVPGG